MAHDQKQIEESKNKFAITTRSGEVIYLSKQTCINYLTNGVNISDSEFTMFFQLCKAYKVNPFLREAYIVKYDSNTPATIVLDYKVLQQLAESKASYNGMIHGVVVADETNKTFERAGEFKLPNERLVAGWCEVYRRDHEHATKVYAMFDEFAGKKKDGSLSKNWKEKPCFMITKVAKVQALREAYPNLIASNTYIQEELENNTDFAEYESIDKTENSEVLPEKSSDYSDKSSVVNDSTTILDIDEKTLF